MALRGAPEMYVIRHVKTGTYWRSTEARGLAGCWVWNRMLATCYTFSALQSERFPEGGVAHDYYTNEPVRVGDTVTSLESLVARTERVYDPCVGCEAPETCRSCKNSKWDSRTGDYVAGHGDTNISPTKAPREVPGLLAADAYESRIHLVPKPIELVLTADDHVRLHGMGVRCD